MAKYRKKPVVIEAIKLEENDISIDKAIDFTGDSYGGFPSNEGITIKTLEGSMMAKWGDFIIKGIQGEFYPCKKDIFEMTYEKVED